MGEKGDTVMDIARVLPGIGQPVVPLVYPDGSRLLLLPHGARVLGLYASSDHQNFLWTNPALATVKSARTFFKSDQWHNSGGDRTWSPRDRPLFPDFPHMEVYWVPPQLDPGLYEPVGRRGGVYSNTCTLTLGRSRQTIQLKILKSWSGKS